MKEEGNVEGARSKLKQLGNVACSKYKFKTILILLFWFIRPSNQCDYLIPGAKRLVPFNNFLYNFSLLKHIIALNATMHRAMP